MSDDIRTVPENFDPEIIAVCECGDLGLKVKLARDQDKYLSINIKAMRDNMWHALEVKRLAEAGVPWAVDELKRL